MALHYSKIVLHVHKAGQTRAELELLYDKLVANAKDIWSREIQGRVTFKNDAGRRIDDLGGDVWQLHPKLVVDTSSDIADAKVDSVTQLIHDSYLQLVWGDDVSREVEEAYWKQSRGTTHEEKNVSRL